MILDDVDFNFKGNQDEWWICENEHCEYSFIAKIRYGKVQKIEEGN